MSFFTASFLLTSSILIVPSSSYEVICDETTSCQGNTIYCPTNDACLVHCDGDFSCSNASIHCPSTSECEIECTNGKSCINATINASTSNGPFDLLCDGPESCRDSIIITSYSSTAMITCNDDESCTSSIIYGSSSTDLIIECLADSSCFESVIFGADTASLNITGCDTEESCADLTVYCPPNSEGQKQCSLQGNDNLGGSNSPNSQGIILYATNGWDDIDIQYTGTFSALHSGSMHCSSSSLKRSTASSYSNDDNLYSDSCTIASDSWSCTDSTKCNSVTDQDEGEGEGVVAVSTTTLSTSTASPNNALQASSSTTSAGMESESNNTLSITLDMATIAVIGGVALCLCCLCGCAMTLCFVWIYRTTKVHPANLQQTHLLGVQMAPHLHDPNHPDYRRHRLSYAPGTTPHDKSDSDEDGDDEDGRSKDDDLESFPAADTTVNQSASSEASEDPDPQGIVHREYTNTISMINPMVMNHSHDEYAGSYHGAHKSTMSISFHPNPSPHLVSPPHHSMFSSNHSNAVNVAVPSVQPQIAMSSSHSMQSGNVPVSAHSGAAIPIRIVAPNGSGVNNNNNASKSGRGHHGRKGSRASKLSIANDEELKAVFDILNREGSVSARYVLEDGNFYIDNPDAVEPLEDDEVDVVSPGNDEMHDDIDEAMNGLPVGDLGQSPNREVLSLSAVADVVSDPQVEELYIAEDEILMNVPKLTPGRSSFEIGSGSGRVSKVSCDDTRTRGKTESELNGNQMNENGNGNEHEMDGMESLECIGDAQSDEEEDLDIGSPPIPPDDVLQIRDDEKKEVEVMESDLENRQTSGSVVIHSDPEQGRGTRGISVALPVINGSRSTRGSSVAVPMHVIRDDAVDAVNSEKLIIQNTNSTKGGPLGNGQESYNQPALPMASGSGITKGNDDDHIVERKVNDYEEAEDALPMNSTKGGRDETPRGISGIGDGVVSLDQDTNPLLGVVGDDKINGNILNESQPALPMGNTKGFKEMERKNNDDDDDEDEDALLMGNTKGGNFTKGMEIMESKQEMDSVSSPLLSDIDHGDNHCTENKGKYAVFTDNDENKDEEEEYVHVDGMNPLLSDEENMTKDGVGIEIPSNGGKDDNDDDIDDDEDEDEDEDEEYDDDMIFDDEFNPLTPGGEHKRIVSGFGGHQE